MKIVKERTRLIFTEYTDNEKRQLDDLVGTMDKVFSYEDPDGRMICFPPGMEKSVRTAFPHVKIEDHSDTYWDYAAITPVQHNAQPRNQLQIDFIQFTLEQANKKRKLAGILSPGTGKMEPYSRKIPTPTGWKRFGDLQVGDEIFGSSGQIIHVLEIYEQGVQDIYEITFSDGRKAYCGKDHLWNVFWDKENHTQLTVPMDQMLLDFKIYDEKRKKNHVDPHIYKYRIPSLREPVRYHRKRVPLDPYVVGAIIGSGFCRDPSRFGFSCADEHVPNEIARRMGLMWKRTGDHRYDFYTRNGSRLRLDEIVGIFPELMDKYSYERTIPDVYRYNTVNVRMELLRGLMDTNGSISEEDHLYDVRYSSTSRVLLEQMRELILGLGYRASITVDKRTYKYRSGFSGSLLIHVPHKFKQHLFTHPKKYKRARHAAMYKRDNKEHYKYITVKNIQLHHQEEARCIRVDAPDELYCTEDFIVTHNTFMACYSAIRVGLRTIIIVPTTGIKQQWGETLTGMFNVDPSKVLMVSKPSDLSHITADFVVVSQATLASINKSYNLDQILKAAKFGIKVIDEVQMWFHNIIKVDGNANICHNWYLTGTFGRSGTEENNLYQEMYGDLAIFREKDKKPTLLNPKPGNVYGMKPHMHVKMMWGTSGLSREEIRAVSNSIRYSERAGKWMRYGLSVPAYMELVIPSDGTETKFLKDLLKLIKMAESSVNYGRTLILGSTINSCEIIAQRVRGMFPGKKVATYHSRNSKQENEEGKASCDILVSTVSSAGTGFDMKDLSKLITCAQWASWILSDQISGRLRRRPDEKDTYMWDFVDSTVPQLRTWANARADVYRRKAKTFKVIDW